MTDSTVLLTDYYDVGGGYNMTFKFQFIKQSNGEIFINILHQPPYRADQPQGAHDTHRYGIGSQPYICFDPQPRNLDDAKVVAAEWAKRTAFYIRHNRWPNV